MARPKNKFPNAGKCARGATWRIYWSLDNGRTYNFSIGKQSADVAESKRLEVALALRTGDWPAWAMTKPAVQRYIAHAAPADASDVLADYERSLKSEVSQEWAHSSMAMLREIETHAGKKLLAVSASDADAFLAHVIETPGPHAKRRGPRARGTRNRFRLVAGRFYRWAMRVGHAQSNPFAHARILAEDDRADIVHLSAEERDAVLGAAEKFPDGIAVWLALYAGLRRGEVAAAAWKDVHLKRRKLDVPKTKTRRRRMVDLAAPLVKRLSLMPASKRRGHVVPWPAEAAAWTHRAEMLLEGIAGEIPRKGRGPIVEPGRIAWNVFRHTFASLLAQGGVSIYKIASWMGNGPAICQRHYAAMMPDHDPDIDRMV